MHSSLRVECDKLWNQVLHAHSRMQQELNSGIEYVHHIVAHTLNHPEAKWLGRWYLGETFPFAHESQFLTIVSTLLWRTLVQTTKNKIMERWQQEPRLRELPWSGDEFVTPEQRKQAMQQYLMQHGEDFERLNVEALRPLLMQHAEEQAEWAWDQVVGTCHDLDVLHRACMLHFQEDVQHSIYALQTTMEDRVPFIRELEQNQGCQLELILNVQSAESANDHRATGDRSMEFVFWFLKDRITFDDDAQWVLMHQVGTETFNVKPVTLNPGPLTVDAKSVTSHLTRDTRMLQVVNELDQHFKDNPSHNASDSPVHDVAVLGREVGYEHAIKERMLDLAPHYEVYGAQDTQEMLMLIMKNGELSKELQDCDEGGFAHVPRVERNLGDDVSAAGDAVGGEALEREPEQEVPGHVTP